MLVLTGIETDLEKAKQLCTSKLESGEALELFRRNIECQGGDPSVCDDPEKLLDPNIVKFDVLAASDGFITAIDTLAIGNAMCEIGGGRTKAEDSIDHAVGFASERKIGTEIKAGDPIGTVYCRSEEQFRAVEPKLRAAYALDATRLESPALILNILP
jgi:thymidine phosphorylase